MREIALITNGDKPTLSMINKCLRNNDELNLIKMLSPSKYKTGASAVLAAEEEAMIFESLIFAGKRVFAVRKDALKSIIMQIDWNGRLSWKNRAPADDTIRAFRAQHRELTFWKSEWKDLSK